ncbi:hypothetical protein ABW20_dc0108504 [Dactylellina cionopaga]|nr:hypothetical protein ABW20_dc0108504 [Dactylellina cionopaga]
MSSSSFYINVDLGRTALLLSDIQTNILSRFPEEVRKTYLEKIQTLLKFFRDEAAKRRSQEFQSHKESVYDEVPLIIHHTFPFNINSNSFVSPYNKLAKWVNGLKQKGYFDNAPSDPHHPNLAIPEELAPPGGWGGNDEVAVTKLQPNCFGSSELLNYLRGRGIHHVVLIGLTTMGSILGSARGGADLDFHIITPREAIIEDVGQEDIDDFLMTRILPKFVDVVHINDVLNLS